MAAIDSSIYTISPPPLKGLLPRMTRELLIDKTRVLVAKSAAGGFLVSGELVGVLALGFVQEVGNFILR